MEIILEKNHARRIVIFGQSCAGKTTFAKQLTDHHYYCFDALFNWHMIEGLGLSICSELDYLREQCTAGKFVLDGWHLADKSGVFFPPDSCVYVLYAPYDQIISQYRVPVPYHDVHRPMFKKWYFDVDYTKYKQVRYFENMGSFIERGRQDFELFLERNR